MRWLGRACPILAAAMAVVLPPASAIAATAPTYSDPISGFEYTAADCRDWLLGDRLVRLHAFVTVLGYSRMVAVRFATVQDFVLEYAANIAISVFLITRIGVVGAAIGTLVPALFNDIFFIPALACRELDLPLASYLRRAWLRPLPRRMPLALHPQTLTPGLPAQ